MLDRAWQSGRFGNVSWLLFSYTFSVSWRRGTQYCLHLAQPCIWNRAPLTAFIFHGIYSYLFLNAFFPTWIQCELFQCKCWGKCPSTLPFFCRFVSLCLSNHIIGLRHDAVFSSLHHGYLFPAVCSPVWCFSRCMQYIFELFICLVGSWHSCPVGLAPLPSQHALLHLDGSL